MSFQYDINKIEKIINYYINKFNYLSLYKDDLRQEALMAVLYAEKKYDSSKNASFETFASFWIQSYIYDFVSDINGVSRSVYRNKKLINDYLDENPNASLEEISSKTELSLKQITSIINGFNVYSLDLIESLDFIPSTYGDLIDDFNRYCIADNLKNHIESTLNNKEKDIIYKAYGINSMQLSLKEIASLYNVSIQYISKVIKASLRKLKYDYEIKEL